MPYIGAEKLNTCKSRNFRAKKEILFEPTKKNPSNTLEILFVAYSKGEPQAYLRFVEANKAAEALAKAAEKAEGKLMLAGAEIRARVLAGEEEEKFWRDTVAKLVEAKKSKNNRKRGGGGKGDWKRKNEEREGNGKRSRRD